MLTGRDRLNDKNTLLFKLCPSNLLLKNSYCLFISNILNLGEEWSYPFFPPQDRISLCGSSFSKTHLTDQAVLELTAPPASSISWVLWLEAGATMPGNRCHHKAWVWSGYHLLPCGATKTWGLAGRVCFCGNPGTRAFLSALLPGSRKVNNFTLSYTPYSHAYHGPKP